MLTGWEPSLSEGLQKFSGWKGHALLRVSALKWAGAPSAFWKLKCDWGCLLYASFPSLLYLPVASSIVRQGGLRPLGTPVPHYCFVEKNRLNHFGFVSTSLGFFEYFGLGEEGAHKDGWERGE